jgi:hypothetical protein
MRSRFEFEFPLFNIVHIGSGAQEASYPVAYWGFLPRDKVAGA